MKDINDLLQSLKAAAEKATPGPWHSSNENKLIIRDEDGTWIAHVGYFDSPVECYDAEFIALANPANVKRLVDALEKAQAINAAAEKLVRCKGRYHSEQNYRALAALFGVTTPDLPPMDSESRTVKLPEPFKMAKSSSGLTYYYADEVNAALTASGIKWEAE